MEGMTPPGGWKQAFIEHLGIELWRIPVVVASAIGIYLIFLLLAPALGGVRILVPATYLQQAQAVIEARAHAASSQPRRARPSRHAKAAPSRPGAAIAAPAMTAPAAPAAPVQ